MNQQIATSPSQSQRLIACGIDPKTADMVWTSWTSDGEKVLFLSVMNEFAYEIDGIEPIGAWSLSRLLALLPAYVDGHYLTIQKVPANQRQDFYGIVYLRCEYQDKTKKDRLKVYSDNKLCSCASNSPIEAVVLTIEWLTKNGHKLNQNDK